MDRILTDSALPQSSRQPQTHWYLRLFATLAQWQRNARTRRQLAQLDDRALADVGISPSERAQELDTPFWR
ncbi:DUF1127 domain-containing protein [Metapseudomonas resinovorans]|uniref:YjiS-like domain-containing protein n=1 Tax=Metapseudomonas resinovorans NBRC 106553 TaxID=1245471 RepID=S6AQ03_METRE|nr:DUF1127 domain-containing protein [Pseudomonas resinovorans]BAN45841.1 hypothetical protein PCA10_01090 [Pseudomonas resinovorans NBRC 106553]